MPHTITSSFEHCFKLVILQNNFNFAFKNENNLYISYFNRYNYIILRILKNKSK